MSLLIRSSRVCGGGSKTGLRTVFGAAATAINRGTGDEYVQHGGRGYPVITVFLAAWFRLVASLCRPSSADKAVPDRPQAERSNLRGAAWWFSESPATMHGCFLDLSNGVGAEEARSEVAGGES